MLTLNKEVLATLSIYTRVDATNLVTAYNTWLKRVGSAAMATHPIGGHLVKQIKDLKYRRPNLIIGGIE